jgi:hypothetical protein
MARGKRKQALATWLHRHGIARTVQSSSSSDRPDVRYLMEARWWTPEWLVVWAARQSFARLYASRAGRLHLGRVQGQPPTEDGTRHWVLHWRPTY